MDILGPANFTNAVTARPFDGRQFLTADTWFKDCSSADAEDGTDLGAAWFNQVTANLRVLTRGNGLRADKLTPVVPEDNADTALYAAVAAMIQRGQCNFAVDQGGANSILINPVGFSPVEIVAGMPFMVQVATTNTGAVTVRVGAFAPVSLRKSGAAPLTGGEFAAGDMIPLVFDGTYFRLIGSAGGSAPQLVTTPSLILLVPDQYPTVRAALLATSAMILRSDANLQIKVTPAVYEETFSAADGPLLGKHPYGQCIQVVGQTLSIGFPSGDDIDNTSASTCLALLKGRFGTRFYCNGVNALEVRFGTLNFSNALFVGDGSSGCNGPTAGNWQTSASSGCLGLSNVWAHGFGGDGFESTDSSVVRHANVGATYNGLAGFRSARNSNMTIRTGSLVSMFNTHGIVTPRGGEFSIDSGATRIDLRRNYQFGGQATADGQIGFTPGPAVYVKNNGNYGFQAYSDGQVYLPPSLVINSNGNGDLLAMEGGLIDATGASVGYTSPYRNSIGNNGALVVI